LQIGPQYSLQDHSN